MKRILSFFLMITVIFSGFAILGRGTATADSAITESQWNERINALRADYPTGTNWDKDDVGYQNGRAKSCHGFAMLAANRIFGTDYASSEWERHHDINRLKKGDIVRRTSGSGIADSHTIIISDVSGDTITFFEANWNLGYNIVEWDRTISRESLNSVMTYILSSPGVVPNGDIYFDTYSVENLYEMDALFSIWLNNPKGQKLSSIGIQVGKTINQYAERELAANVFWTRSNQQCYLSSVWGAYLESDTQYYARYYAKSGNTLYYSDWQSIKTPAGGISFDSYEIEDIQDRNAKPSTWISNPNGRRLSTIGIEFGESINSTSKTIVANNVSWTRSHLNYYIGEELKPNTLYYARYYVETEGKIVFSDWVSFKTKEAYITFDSLETSDITYNNIKLFCWLNNTKGLTLTEIGVELGKTMSSSTRKRIYGNVKWTRAALSYDMRDYFGELDASSTYYIRYYVTVGSKTYFSSWLTANTVAKPTYTVHYDANGGTGAPDSQTKTHGTALTLSSGIPTRDGYTFSGWATNADAVTAAYQPSDQYTGDANIMLYAVWSPFSMDVTKTVFDFGEPIMVTADSAKTKAWVGLFKRGESTDSTKWICWYYVREHRNTPCDVTAWPENNPRADRLLPGEYTLALYSDDAGDILKSIDISVKMSEPDFKLPPSLKEIESEAFEGGAFIYVSVPSGVTMIGARAFADCPKLQHIEILGPDTWIDPTSFAGVSELTIHGADGSYAEFYASKYGFNFIAE